MKLGKYSFGIGDRFAHQGKAQLSAIMLAKEQGINITPVWNKSFREHDIVGSKPADVRAEADSAVKALNWRDAYFVDADHIGMKNVDFFLESSDFFTIDVADFIGKPADEKKVSLFIEQHKKYIGDLLVPGIQDKIEISKSKIEAIARKYLFAIEEAGKIYAHIFTKKGSQPFVVEVSMDETNEPQTPIELFFILAGLAQKEIPLSTLAPKFSGRFNKGVDYVGDVSQFQTEFEQDIAVIKFAKKEFKLPQDVKLSVHSGSDKFSIYPSIGLALKKFNAGVHIKTAGTTWLEEIIGLAEAGDKGLEIAKDIYRNAYHRFEELSKPYATVIDIDPKRLPTPDQVYQWDGATYAGTLRHDKTNPIYNPNFRQLLHVGYKVAAEMKDRYLDALKQFEDVIAINVTQNIFDRHIKPIFMAKK
ncbi:MAG TPA: tagaturonate epimerase family protein [bacterium]